MTSYNRLRLVDPQAMLSEFDFEADDVARLAAAKSADELVAAFIAAESWRGLAQALTFMFARREAVWVTCLWARACENAKLVAPSKALRAAEAWVRDQSEDVRYKAFELASDEKMAGPGSWAALAAFWSGPTLSQPEFEAVPPAPGLAAIAASTAFTLAASAFAARDGAERDLVVLALSVASGESGVDRLAELFDAGDVAAAQS